MQIKEDLFLYLPSFSFISNLILCSALFSRSLFLSLFLTSLLSFCVRKLCFFRIYIYKKIYTYCIPAYIHTYIRYVHVQYISIYSLHFSSHSQVIHRNIWNFETLFPCLEIIIIYVIIVIPLLTTEGKASLLLHPKAKITQVKRKFVSPVWN